MKRRPPFIGRDRPSGLGLYDTTFDEFARFAGPAIGAGSAIVFTRLFSRRA